MNKKIDSLVNYYNLKKKDTIIIENGKSFNLGKFDENNLELMDILSNLRKSEDYVIEGENLIINFDYGKARPYIRYLLNNIDDSQELSSIKWATFFIYLILFLSVIIFLFLILINSKQNGLSQNQKIIITKLNKTEKKQNSIDNFFNTPAAKIIEPTKEEQKKNREKDKIDIQGSGINTSI